MNILICHNYYRIRAGEAQSVLYEKDLLEKHGHRVVLYTRDNRSIDGMSRVGRLLLFSRMLFSRRTHTEIQKLIREHRPDVAHVHNIFPLISPSVYYALKKHKVPILQVLHNYRFVCPNGLLLDNQKNICDKCTRGKLWPAVKGRCYRGSFWQSFALAFCLKLHKKLGSFRKIDLFLAPSEFMRQRMIQSGFSSDTIAVRVHHLNLDRFEPAASPSNYAVYMGRLSQEKGVWTLVKAVAGLTQHRLEIVGEGPFRRNLENFIETRGLTHIQLHGFIDSDMRFDILRNAAFLVFPSEWYENCPYTLLESLALGVPVLAARVGGVSEIIEEGITGELFPAGKVEELREKMEGFWADPIKLKSMRIAAREAALTKYNPDRAYEDLMEIHSRVGLDPAVNRNHEH
jgi:glycosyltransferase involved in cell wall biosynthesis